VAADGVRPDPGGVQAAIDRYRDLAKYLITIFAGVGAVLIAGTQLASIGDLSFDDEPGRVIAVIVGLILAIAAIAGVVALALKVLRPVEMTLEEVIADAELRPELERRTWLLGGANSLEEVRDNLQTTALSNEDRESWSAVADEIVGYAAYLKARETFDSTWWPLLIAGVVGVIGITAFTWGANPPEDEAGKANVIEPAPVAVQISLTSEGQEALADALGGKRCAERPIEALAIGGSATKPKVVTLQSGTCKAAQFVLAPEWGAATRPGRWPTTPTHRSPKPSG
jgi:hypothetical protein